MCVQEVSRFFCYFSICAISRIFCCIIFPFLAHTMLQFLFLQFPTKKRLQLHHNLVSQFFFFFNQTECKNKAKNTQRRVVFSGQDNLAILLLVRQMYKKISSGQEINLPPVHSSEIRGLCLMKYPSETLQNLLCFWNSFFFVFQKYGKFLSVSLELFIVQKPLILNY